MYIYYIYIISYYIIILYYIILYYHIILGITIGIKNRFKNKTSLSSYDSITYTFTITLVTTYNGIIISMTLGIIYPLNGSQVGSSVHILEGGVTVRTVGSFV